MFKLMFKVSSYILFENIHERNFRAHVRIKQKYTGDVFYNLRMVKFTKFQKNRNLWGKIYTYIQLKQQIKYQGGQFVQCT